MSLEDKSLIGRLSVAGAGQHFQAVNPHSGALLPPLYGSLTSGGHQPRLPSGRTGKHPLQRNIATTARPAGDIASELERIVEPLISETGLPVSRLSAEYARTCQQLRLFAEVVRFMPVPSGCIRPGADVSACRNRRTQSPRNSIHNVVVSNTAPSEMQDG